MILLDARIFDPAARQKSLAWYATGQRTQRIRRPKNMRSRKIRGAKEKNRLKYMNYSSLFASTEKLSQIEWSTTWGKDLKYPIHYEKFRWDHCDMSQGVRSQNCKWVCFTKESPPQTPAQTPKEGAKGGDGDRDVHNQNKKPGRRKTNACFCCQLVCDS